MSQTNIHSVSKSTIMFSKRIKLAENILNLQGIENPIFLGEGIEGVVFHNNINVYKILLPLEELKFSFEKAYRRKSFFIDIPKNLKHLYRIELIKTSDSAIIKYPYHKGIACLNYTEQEAISILTELWQQKIIITDCKPQNCIRVDGQIKVIDLDGKEYTDNLFLNMCARMYLYIHFSMKIDELEFTKLKRSAINNFELVELQGLREFVNKVFTNIIYEESIQFRQTLYTKKNKHLVAEHYTFNNLPNLELLFFDKIKNGLYLSDVHISNPKINSSNYFEPEQIIIEYTKLNQENKNVSLLIKTCAQDVETIEENIKHIGYVSLSVSLG